MSLDITKKRKCVPIVCADLRGYFEISVFEILRVVCLTQMSVPDAYMYVFEF